MGFQRIVRAVGTETSLIAQAYNIPVPQEIVVGMNRMSNEIYRIEASIPDGVYAQMEHGGAAQRRQIVQLMLQALLGERFGLKVHFGMKELPVYKLVIAKGGSKLPEPSEGGSSGGWALSPQGDLRVRGMKLETLLQSPMFGLTDRVVVNRTGLDGSYNLNLHWHPARGDQGLGGDPAFLPSGDEPSIFTAVKEQLGLELVAGREPVEVLYIDNLTAPTPN
jgi:uncharacterized protein (TIGR03435 family)